MRSNINKVMFYFIFRKIEPSSMNNLFLRPSLFSLRYSNYFYIDTSLLFFNFNTKSVLVLNLVNLFRFNNNFRFTPSEEKVIYFFSIKNESNVLLIKGSDKTKVKVFREPMRIKFHAYEFFFDHTNQLEYAIVQKKEEPEIFNDGMLNCTDLQWKPWARLVQCNMIPECSESEDEIGSLFYNYWLFVNISAYYLPVELKSFIQINAFVFC